MRTNEERREVASKLRDIEFKNNWFSPWCKSVETILDGKDCGEDDGTCNEDECCKRFLKEIADLIEPEPERTGTPVLDDQGWIMWRCSECGQPINRADNYCSSCGVKVTPIPL